MGDERPFPEPDTPWGRRWLELQALHKSWGMDYLCPTQEQMSTLELLYACKDAGPEVTYLGIWFDDERLMICRSNHQPVKVPGRLMRTLARILVDREDRFTSQDILLMAWDPCFRDLGLLNKQLTGLRKYMRLLGIDIENVKGIGWRLVESSK